MDVDITDEVLTDDEAATEQVIDNHEEFRCEDCSKEHRNKNALDCHVRQHHGSKSVMCDLFGASFDSGSRLSPHKRNHHSPKVSCEECGLEVARD